MEKTLEAVCCHQTNQTRGLYGLDFLLVHRVHVSMEPRSPVPRCDQSYVSVTFTTASSDVDGALGEIIGLGVTDSERPTIIHMAT